MRILSEYEQGLMQVLFNRIADERTPGGKEGPEAAEMRAFGRRAQLTKVELAYITGVATGQVALYGDVIQEGRGHLIECPEALVAPWSEVDAAGRSPFDAEAAATHAAAALLRRFAEPKS